jgi:hypothetical protein
MRKFNMLVLDEFVSVTGTGNYVYTRTDLNETLGQADKLALQVVGDQASGSFNVTARIQHSADGINWITKGGSPEVTLSVSSNATSTAAGSDAGTTPSLGLVRIAVQLSASGQAHVKVWATGRDDG